MILVIDNYDSFTWNLVQCLRMQGGEVEVVANDAVDVAGIRGMRPSSLLLSPGPGDPDGAGVTLSALEAFAGELPIFGVCLGHQSIAQHFGARVVSAPRLMHGRTSEVEHDGSGMFAGVPTPFLAARYHSLIVDEASLPADLIPNAYTKSGELMGVRHRQLPVAGVQFHPESFLTEHGLVLLKNVVAMSQLCRRSA